MTPNAATPDTACRPAPELGGLLDVTLADEAELDDDADAEDKPELAELDGIDMDEICWAQTPCPAPVPKAQKLVAQSWFSSQRSPSWREPGTMEEVKVDVGVDDAEAEEDVGAEVTVEEQVPLSEL